MTFDEFYTEYRKHDAERPYRKQLAHDGYEYHYANGDVYRHIETLKPSAATFLGHYGADAFDSVNTWNGHNIDMRA